MGLSEFEECSSRSGYCCPSVDRSLTTRLIEVSNSPFKYCSRFAHRPEWVDGLDRWTSVENSNTKDDLTRRHLDFHNDIGLYLPRHEKPNSAPISLKGFHANAKLTTNNFTPERIRQLLRKEKDLLTENSWSNQKSLIEDQMPPVPTNTFRQSTSIQLSQTNEVRLPLRHSTHKSPSPPQQQQQTNSSLNQDTLKSLLKEHLTSLLTRGASTLNGNRSLVNVPPVEIKQQNRIESKLIEDRYLKMEDLNGTLSFQQQKSNATPPLVIYPKPTFGLTVTPVDLSSQKNFQSVSLEKMAQKTFLQDNDSSSVSSSRPSTQPIPLPSSTYQQQQQQPQKVILRRNLETTNSSSNENFLSHETSIKSNDQYQTMQNIRKFPSNNRSSSKTGVHRTTMPSSSTITTTTTTTTTIELLPPIISGKRLHIPVGNHRYL
ncbi:unnamed protein product [Rotaria socialis]|uniref:Uncharacterized protein n=1 Tax=Rotaria socialis TaxID=392032 RepID=A0A817VI02_9BILA|nr:unnamed protein product [Rotaria socialis]CAF3358278.1 unnamed protein product [Rotaria socialis]CAF3469676.1 unnamed protein product [Rotaria socialis]CAF3516694.1 unnamed protein product [Rotaria socialis]CAF3662054.1 unnamed protein product [Rotaria socialis]